MHDFHDALPGYSPMQILHDGCGECEQRSASRNHGIASLDTFNFQAAWERAAEWNLHGRSDISAAEAPMLDVLWAVQVQLERLGIPIGMVPR